VIGNTNELRTTIIMISVIAKYSLHPPHDPPETLDQQLEIIQGLASEAGYIFKTCDDFVKEDIYGY
jgi:hypothetical protein